MSERWVTRKMVYDGRIFSVEAGTAALADGRLVPRERVVNPGGVAVVPLLGETVLLIRQFRIAAGETLLELPAGRLEATDVDPADRGAQELEEEAGYRAGKLTLLADYYSSAGFSSERMFIFLATGLTAVPPRPEFDEQIAVVPLPLADLPGLLDGGTLRDAKTIIGLRALLARPSLWREGG